MTLDTADTRAAVHMVLDAVNDLDVEEILALGRDDALAALLLLNDANRVLAQVRSQVEPGVAELMGEHQVTVEGVGTFVRHKRKNRTQWDRQELLRAVLDSRIVDPDTGEIADPTPLDKVLDVWNLGAPRVTALRNRGIDPDEFARVEDAGWSIEVIA